MTWRGIKKEIQLVKAIRRNFGKLFLPFWFQNLTKLEIIHLVQVYANTYIYMCARDKNTKKLIKKMYEANLISHHPSRKHDILRALIKNRY